MALGVSLEDPYDRLEIDLVNNDPHELYDAMLRLTNTLMELYRKRSGIKAELLGMKATKKDPEYVSKAIDDDKVKRAIEAVELKHSTIRAIVYGRSKEMQYLK